MLVSVLVLFGACYGAILIVRATKDLHPQTPGPFFRGEVLNIAHRGASGRAPEHTLEAYDRAVAEGADVLELDVRLSADGVPVVIHDPTLERTLGAAGLVDETPLDELRAAGDPGEPPTLEEVLLRYPDRRFNVELKVDDPALADAVARLVRDRGIHRSILVASFHGDVLQRFRRRTGGRVATSASGSESIRFYLCYLMEIPCRLDYQALQLPVGVSWVPDLGRADFIEFAHRHGLEVHFWTVDDEARMRQLLAAGADGIMTNFPARVDRVLRE